MYGPQQAQKVMSQITLFFGVAPALAPLVGGWLLVHVGWHAVFWFLSGVGVLLWLANYRLLPETLHVAQRQPFHPRNLLAYMLIGYDKRETWERLFHRFNRMVAREIRPYPMVFGDRDRTIPLGGCIQRIEKRTLREFQRWVIRKAYTFIPFEAYDVNAKGRATEGQLDLLAAE